MKEQTPPQKGQNEANFMKLGSPSLVIAVIGSANSPIRTKYLAVGFKPKHCIL